MRNNGVLVLLILFAVGFFVGATDLVVASAGGGLTPEHSPIIEASINGEHDKALRMIRELRAKEPNDYRHVRVEALVYRSAWNNTPEGYDEAKRDEIHLESIRLFREAIEMAERWGADGDVIAEMHERIARAYWANREFDLADLELERALKRWPDNVHLWALRGEVQWGKYMASSLPQNERIAFALQSVVYHEKAIELNGGTKPRWLIPESYIHAADKRYSDGDYKTAEAYLIIGIGQLDQSGVKSNYFNQLRDVAFRLLNRIYDERK